MTEQSERDKQDTQPETREETLTAVGDILRNKRMDASISMRDIAKELNIREPYLQALEAGDWSKLPEEVYALGFLRQYARYLQCDVNEHIQKIKSNDYALSKPIIFPDPPIAPNRKWMMIGLIAFLVLLIVFNVVKRQAPSPLPSELMKNHAQQATPLENEALLQDAEQQKEPAATPKEHASQASIGEHIVPDSKEQPHNTGAKPMTSTVHAKPSKSLALPQSTTQTSQLVQNENQEITSIEHIYTFTAQTSDVWLQVYQQDHLNKPLREALLKQGESFSITSAYTLVITTGKPKSLEVRVDGKVVIAAGTMANKDHVVRNFILPKTNK